MAMTPNSSDTGLPSEGASHMVIELGYSCKLLLSIKDGNDFLAAYSRAREWKEEYQKDPKVLPSPPEIKVKYVTAMQLAKTKFDDMLGLSDE